MQEKNDGNTAQKIETVGDGMTVRVESKGHWVNAVDWRRLRTKIESIKKPSPWFNVLAGAALSFAITLIGLVFADPTRKVLLGVLIVVAFLAAIAAVILERFVNNKHTISMEETLGHMDDMDEKAGDVTIVDGGDRGDDEGNTAPTTSPMSPDPTPPASPTSTPRSTYPSSDTATSNSFASKRLGEMMRKMLGEE